MNNLFRSPARPCQNGSFGERLRVLVLPASNGAGASYISSQILQKGPFSHHAPSGQRTLVEIGKPHFYDALGMDKRFFGREFYDFENDKGKIGENLEMGYNWYLRRRDGALEDAVLFKIAAMAPGNLVVFDASSSINDASVLKLIPEMDIVYLVIDPLPSKLIPAWGYIDLLRSTYPEIKLVVNKFNNGIHKGQLSAFLGTQNYYTQDAVPFEHLCRREYNCILP